MTEYHGQPPVNKETSLYRIPDTTEKYRYHPNTNVLLVTSAPSKNGLAGILLHDAIHSQPAFTPLSIGAIKEVFISSTYEGMYHLICGHGLAYTAIITGTVKSIDVVERLIAFKGV